MGSRGSVQDSARDTGRREINDSVRGGAPAGAVGELLEKLQKLEFELSEQKGSFDLFGLILREDSLDRWDVVVAAPWFGADKRNILKLLTEKLAESLGAAEMMMISRVVPLAYHDRFLSAIQGIARLEHGLREIGDIDLAGVRVSRGYLITCQSSRGGQRRN